MASLSRQPAEVDWESLDKGKFVYTGALMFSGVTTLLFPLSVLKTRQMALPGVSGGFEGVRQTAIDVWKVDGARGFYRGFGTVMLGTIPGRSVYLSTLEYVKSGVNQAGSKHLNLSEPVLAGASNFVAGAVASLTTQCVTVPIDIISQRQMVYGSQTHEQHGRTQTGTTPHTSSAQSAASATTTTAASQAHPTAARPTAGSSRVKLPSSSGGSSSLHHTSASHPSSAGSVSASLSPAQEAQKTSSSRARFSTSASSSTGALPQAQSMDGKLGSTRVSGLHIARSILRTEGVAGFYRGFGASVATLVPSSAVWWGAYGAYQKLLWTLYDESTAMFTVSAATPLSVGMAGIAQATVTPLPTGSEIVVVQTLASILAGSTSTLITNPLDLIKTRIQVATRVHGQADVTISSVLRQILKEDGPRGLLRGVLPRMVNASMWGTCMVSVYEYLKRVCRKTEEDGSPYRGA